MKKVWFGVVLVLASSITATANAAAVTVPAGAGVYNGLSSRKVLRPAEVVDRQACKANAMNCCSAGG